MGRIDIEKAMDNLLIKSKGELLSRIEQVSSEISIEGTKSVATCYMLKIDANGNTRLKDLVDFIDRKLIEYSIPKKEIDEAKEYFIETGSPSKVDELKSKAKTLFTELDKTGEGGEILLYPTLFTLKRKKSFNLLLSSRLFVIFVWLIKKRTNRLFP